MRRGRICSVVHEGAFLSRWAAQKLRQINRLRHQTQLRPHAAAKGRVRTHKTNDGSQNAPSNWLRERERPFIGAQKSTPRCVVLTLHSESDAVGVCCCQRRFASCRETESHDKHRRLRMESIVNQFHTHLPLYWIYIRSARAQQQRALSLRLIFGDV